jgi:virginiamycin B lyase
LIALVPTIIFYSGSRTSLLRTILLRSFIRSLATNFSFPFLLAFIFIMIEVNLEEIGATLQSATTSRQNEELHALETFKNGFCGIDAKPNSTEYVTEYVLPQSCEMPLGIDVDIREDKVWYVSTKHGILGSYDFEEDKFNEEIRIPTWISHNNAREFSQVWDVKVDNRRGENGYIWFTDEKQNALWRYVESSDTFEMYPVPGESQDFGTIYPASIELVPNNDNIIYLVGMFSPSIWIAEIDRLRNGTSDGISEIPIPIEGFERTDPVFVTTGRLVFDEKENALWISVMTYGYKGQIFRYNLDKESFDIFDLPRELNSPWGMTIDDNGDAWVTNAGTSIFYKLSPKEDNDGDNNGNENVKNIKIEKFVTSKGSSRIFGKLPENNAEKNFQNRYYTLPSFIKKSDDDSIWFNEQHGNKISKFDPMDGTLIEYWVPTQNRLWGICSNDDPINSNGSIKIDTCGIANVLQLSIGNNDDSDVWFSEWSENKIGKVDTAKEPPFSIDIFKSDEELTVERGEKERIKLIVKATSESPSSSLNNIRMVASSTFTSSGDIGNSTGHFAEQSSLISMEEGEEHEVSFEFIPSADLKPGEYTLMIGAENDSISYLKAVKLEIN